MRYFYKDKEIHSKEEWKLAFCESYSGKDDDKHWKPGRSGERLADDFMGENPCGENTMIDMVQKLIGAENVSLEIAKIEHASVFDKHPRPRIQDLAIWGHADGNRIFIGVEAKVDESFGSVSLSQQKAKVEKMKIEGIVIKYNKASGIIKGNNNIEYIFTKNNIKGDIELSINDKVLFLPEEYKTIEVSELIATFIERL